MADTGWKSPTTNGARNIDWTNPDRVYTSNDQYATVHSEDEDYKAHSYENFDFGIPAGATIDGIEVSVEAYYTGDACSGYSVLWWCESDEANSWSRIPWGLWTVTVEATKVGGSNEDLWGRTPIDTDFSDANFSLVIRGQADESDVNDFYIDHVQVKVYYTEVAPATFIPTVTII